MKRIHREGYSFLSVLLILLLGINIGGQFFSIIGFYPNISLLVSVFILLFFLQFFRNPKIKKTIDNSKVISPANGKVVNIEEVYEVETDKVLTEAKEKISKMSESSKHIGFGLSWVKNNGKLVYESN